MKTTETTHASWDALQPRLGDISGKIYAYFLRQGSTGATCAEAEKALDMKHQTVSGRITNMHSKLGLLRVVGKRLNPETGLENHVYVAVPQDEAVPQAALKKHRKEGNPVAVQPVNVFALVDHVATAVQKGLRDQKVISGKVSDDSLKRILRTFLIGGASAGLKEQGIPVTDGRTLAVGDQAELPLERDIA